MSIISFLRSRVFLQQIVLAIIAVVLLVFLMLSWLKSTTNHGEFIEVPDLKGKSLETVNIELKDLKLRMEIQDSANYNPNYPKYAVIEQYPLAGEAVKEDRKIYLILNPSGYRKVQVPDVVRRTFRQAKPTLESVGFEIGTITYKDDIGKDEVLDMLYKGSKISNGDQLPLTSKIDLVLGNGKRPGSSLVIEDEESTTVQDN